MKEEDLFYCPMCELEHENNSMCQAGDPDRVLERYEDKHGV